MPPPAPQLQRARLSCHQLLPCLVLRHLLPESFNATTIAFDSLLFPLVQTKTTVQDFHSSLRASRLVLGAVGALRRVFFFFLNRFFCWLRLRFFLLPPPPRASPSRLGGLPPWPDCPCPCPFPCCCGFFDRGSGTGLGWYMYGDFAMTARNCSKGPSSNTCSTNKQGAPRREYNQIKRYQLRVCPRLVCVNRRGYLA